MVAVQPRVRLALMAAATIVLVAALAVVLFAHGGSDRQNRPGFAGALAPADVRTTDFALRDQDGRVTRLRDFRGSPVILTFLYSTCQDTCPLTAQQIKAAQQQIGRTVPALAISVDPAGDTPFHVWRFLNKEGLNGRMRFLTGSWQQLSPIWKAYGIRPQQGSQFDHSARVLLFDRRGRERVVWPVEHLTPEGLAHDLRLLLLR
jgi:protein SCO1/2